MGRNTLLQILTLLIMRSTFDGPQFVLAVWNHTCTSGCVCCIEQQCGQGPYFPNECTKGCIDGHRSARCYELCENNCKTCSQGITICGDCYESFYLDNTNCVSCPTNCKTCSSSSECQSCKEGFENGDGSICEYSICPENCNCNVKNCISCKNGYFETVNSCNDKCPDHCVACTSLQVCTVCIDGYYNGNKIVNGNNIWLNDCTHECRKTCVRCSSYDQCHQCKTGKYGTQCQYNCSIGCKDGTCELSTGNCVCSVNFDGDKCDTCTKGKYGDQCDRSCPPFCKNKDCYRSSGNCREGCVTDNFSGDKCETCILGRHGTNCDKKCPDYCQNDNCGRYTGFCTDGCDGNFNGSQCTKCIQGKYGDVCDQDCPKNCLNGICIKISGNCEKCLGNFDGDTCSACRPGFYGTDCIQTCPGNCLHGRCDISDGKCSDGCINNFSGDRCCADSKNCMDCKSDTECKTCIPGYFGLSCENACPTNCTSTCEFGTGVCTDCKKDIFGEFCNFSCSDRCNVSQDVSKSRCAAKNGTCIFGCKDGSFGQTCNETCSHLCIENMCVQASGICSKGCLCPKSEDPVCAMDLGQLEDEESPSGTVVALGSSLAISIAVHIVVVAVCVLKKIKKSRRKINRSRKDHTYENQMTTLRGEEHVTEHTQNNTEVTQSEASKAYVYEDIRRAIEPEHEYQHMA